MLAFGSLAGGEPPVPLKIGRYVMERSRKVTVRLSEEELHSLKKLVEDSGWSQEAYLRALIEGAVPAPRPPPDFKAMTVELRRIGVNLNQIARVANATGSMDAAACLEARQRLEESVAAIVKAVTAPRRLEWRPHRSGK